MLRQAERPSISRPFKSQRFTRQSGQRYAVMGEHMYNPSREPSHQRLKGTLHSDPQGFDWNRLIAQEVYLSQARLKTLELASLDFYATTRTETIPPRSQEAKELKLALKDRGVGDPFLHVLLPDLSENDKTLLIRAGQAAFKTDTGIYPQWFWAPETALDIQTLLSLQTAGYRGVICAPEQVWTRGEAADNRPISMTLPNGKPFLLLPFDRPISSDIAFSDKGNADHYTWGKIVPRLDYLQRISPTLPLVSWTDGETFGHHAKKGDLFLDYLLKQSLPQAGIAVLGINQLPEVWEKPDYIEGTLKNRSAWSCGHGDLVRWHGACPCDDGFHGGWKGPFTAAVHQFNAGVTEIIDQQLPSQWRDELASSFKDAFYYKGASNTQQSLLAAKASALGGLISCGTFFNSPQTSGRINMLFVRQAVEHLIDANHSRAARQLLSQLNATLAHGTDPHTGQRLHTEFADILTHQA